MTWKDPDWKQGRPSDAEVDSRWRSVTLTPVASPSDVEPYLVELRRVNANGDALFGIFQVEGDQNLDWFASRNRWDHVDFVRRVLSHPAVRERWPALVAKMSDAQFPAFEWGSKLALDGELARALVIGGAYERFTGRQREAKDLAAKFCDALFGDRFQDIEVFWCWRAWSAWFHDVAWDRTCLIIDRPSRTIAILCSTDTD